MCERDSIIRAGDGTCFGAVVGGAQGIVRVGAPFLRSVYTYVGMFDNRLCWAEAVFFFLDNLVRRKRRTGPSRFSLGLRRRSCVRGEICAIESLCGECP